jgi:hypothetical protein
MVMFAACYQQPVLSPQRPLQCTLSQQMTDECPKGYACQGGVCGPTSCQHTADCPTGLSCTNRGCVVLADGGQPDGPIQLPYDRDASSPESSVVDLLPAPDALPVVVDGGQD